MRKLLSVLILCFALTGCSEIPMYVKEAQRESILLHAENRQSSFNLLGRTLEGYKEEAFAHIAFRSEIARKQGVPEEKIATWEKKALVAVSKEIDKVTAKDLELKGDWEKAIRLQAKVSEYMNEVVDVKGIIRGK